MFLISTLSCFHFWSTTYYHGNYIFQCILFARVYSHLTDFNARNESSTAHYYNKAIGIINFGKLFSKFYRRRIELVSKYNAD